MFPTAPGQPLRDRPAGSGASCRGEGRGCAQALRQRGQAWPLVRIEHQHVLHSAISWPPLRRCTCSNAVVAGGLVPSAPPPLVRHAQARPTHTYTSQTHFTHLCALPRAHVEQRPSSRFLAYLEGRPLWPRDAFGPFLTALEAAHQDITAELLARMLDAKRRPWCVGWLGVAPARRSVGSVRCGGA